jgi:translocator protein
MFHRVNLLKLLACVLLCQLAGAFGSAMASSLGNGIFENQLSTPLWVFFPVWIILHTLMEIFLYLVWEKELEQEIKMGLVIFGIQLGLSALWSFLS